MDFTRPFLLIDLSSYIFYRNFALHRWMTAAKIDTTTFSKEEFQAKYCKLFEDNIIAYQKKLKVPWQNIILAKDCPRDQIWRLDVYPQYKQSRPKQIANFDPAIFTMAYGKLIPDMLSKYKMHLLGVDHAEGDDIIAVICNKIKRKYSVPVYIMSCDNDFLQLQDETTNVLDFQMKPLAKAAAQKLLDVFIKWKVIFGDESDNIPAIDAKIGKVTAERLARNDDLLAQKLQNSVIKAAYERNDVLINFDRIPVPLKKSIEKLLD